MADKRISDFSTVADLQDSDLMLVSSEDETYNVQVKTLKEIAQKDAQQVANSAVKEFFAPIAVSASDDGVSYTSDGQDLPVVESDAEDPLAADGFGRRIIFVPRKSNTSTRPTLQLNGGECITIVMRGPKNRGGSEDTPEATVGVPKGMLMCGVPYTMTFCGAYWLIDSMIDVNAPINKSPEYLTWLPETGEKTILSYADTLDDGLYYISETPLLTPNWIWIKTYTYRGEDTRYTFMLSLSKEGVSKQIYRDGTLIVSPGDLTVLATTDKSSLVAAINEVASKVPKPTAEDAGKVLTVSDAGAAIWTAVANAEEVAF